MASNIQENAGAVEDLLDKLREEKDAGAIKQGAKEVEEEVTCNHVSGG